MAPTVAAFSPDVIDIDGSRYYLRQLQNDRVIKEDLGPGNWLPFTLISCNDSNLDPEYISAEIDKFSKKDDVWSPSFLSTILIQSQSPLLVPEPRRLLSYNTSRIIFTVASSLDSLLPPGPYVSLGDGTYGAWRLYSDELGAFEIPVIAYNSSRSWHASITLYDKHDAFSPLALSDPEGIYKAVAVPSRLYAKPSRRKPLAGMRFTVKDNFKLAGIKTTMSNRDFTHLYPPEQETAKYVGLLTDLGATIVAKTRMSSFASGQEPTDQWVDTHCPINPRGDGYQSPGSSSSGAAASLAGQSFIDIAIGTDSSGSIRAPAASNGVYGLRTSWGAASMTGVHPLARDFDTIGILSRDLPSLYKVVINTIPSSRMEMLPTKLVIFEEFSTTNDPIQQQMYNKYISILEDYLGVNKTLVSLRKQWETNSPSSAEDKSLEEFAGESTNILYYHDAHHSYDGFRKDHGQLRGGTPYEGPVPRYRSSVGKDITHEQMATARPRLAEFRAWFDKHVFEQDLDGCSNTLLIVLPKGKVVPNYRDKHHLIPRRMWILGNDTNTLATTVGIPHLVIPIGQIPYISKISGKTEYLPVSASLLGPKGSDATLVKVVYEAFRKAGWPTSVQTGKVAFPLETPQTGNTANGEMDEE